MSCECECRGCKLFHIGRDPDPGETYARILMALDLSVAAAARARGVPACNGQADDPHAATGCDIGDLHSTAGLFAHVLARAIELADATDDKVRERLDNFLRSLAFQLGAKPVLS